MDSHNGSRNGEARSRRDSSLIAFLRAIKFGKPKRDSDAFERDFAHPHPKARQPSDTTEDANWVRSAN